MVRNEIKSILFFQCEGIETPRAGSSLTDFSFTKKEDTTAMVVGKIENLPLPSLTISDVSLTIHSRELGLK